MTRQQIGTRIKALREERKLSQDSLARHLGFKDRQTVSAIETGVRRVTAEELVLAVEKFGTPLEYFTDPSCSPAKAASHGANGASSWLRLL